MEQLRNQIDELDREIVKLLARRVRIAQELGRLKRSSGRPIVDEQREAQVIRNILAAGAAEHLAAAELEQLYREVIALCRNAQNPKA